MKETSLLYDRLVHAFTNGFRNAGYSWWLRKCNFLNVRTRGIVCISYDKRTNGQLKHYICLCMCSRISEVFSHSHTAI